MALPSVFERGTYLLESLGLTDVLLPFLLIFTIVFAVLQKTKIFGEDKKNFNIVIALVMALAVVIPHVTGRYPPGADIVDIINRALPNVGIVAVVIIMVLLLVGLLGFSGSGTNIAGLIAAVALVAVIWIFYRAARPYQGPGGYFSNALANPDVQALLIIIVVFGLVVWYITKEPKERAAGGRLMESIKKLFD